MTLREALAEFRAAGKALGHFNVSDSNQLEALAEVAKEETLPIVVGLSEGERAFFPLSHARALVNAYRAEGVPLYLNADHTYSEEKARAAIDDNVDSIVVDGAKLSLEENITLVKAVVDYARTRGRDVVVEGELGYIGSSSVQLDTLPEGVSEAHLTTPEDAQRFVEETGVDCFAPAVGNVHGMLRSAPEPRLNIERVRAIAAATGVPLVLHGASGNSDEDIAAAIAAGVALVHINTELRVAYHDALKETLNESEETTPYKFLGPAVGDMKELVTRKVRLFANK